MNDYVEAMKNNKIIVGRNKTLSRVGWKPPGTDWVSLNTDGACVDGRESGCRGIIRTTNSECTRCFAKHLGNCSVVRVELWGVSEGLKFVMEMGVSRVVLQVDSNTVVDLIKSGNNLGMDSFSLLNLIRWMLERLKYLTHIEKQTIVLMLWLSMELLVVKI